MTIASWCNFVARDILIGKVLRRSCFAIGNEQMTYLIDGVAIDLADVIGPGWGLLDHLERDWGKNAVLSALSAEVATLAILDIAACLVEEAWLPAERGCSWRAWIEEALILACELYNH